MSFLLTFAFLSPISSAKAEELVIACPGGGGYTIIMPAGVAVNGKNCAGSLVIDSRVKIIGKAAFSFSKIESVEIPNSVTSIEASGFSYTPLKSISIGNSLESIGFEAFRSSRFESITLPNSLKSIGECALCDTYFSSIVLPSSLVTIGKLAFAREDSQVPLKSIEIPDSVMDIGWYAFTSAGLENLKLGKSIKTIQPGAFQNNKIKRVDIPASVKWISAFAFKRNPLEVLNLSEGLTGIDSEAFAYTRITNLVIPSTLTELGSRAFANIPTLITVDMSDNLQPGISNATNLPSIGDVFEESYGIEKVIYCGTAQGFLVKPTCEGARKIAADPVAKAEAEKAAAELKAKQEADAKAAADLKAKQEADAKSASTKKTTITCIKGKLTKKVTAVNPKCPAGYKKK